MAGSPRPSASGFDVPSLSSKKPLSQMSTNVSSRRRKGRKNKLPPTNPIQGTEKRAPIQASTPSKTPCINDNHFLHGINFENCQDLLSIPDPPTPQSNPRSVKASRRRRQSSPFVAIPLRNMTNEQEPPSVVSKRKSRRSLCHVPSPVLSESNEEVQPESNAKRTQSTTVINHPSSPPTTLRVHEDWGGDEEESSRSRKRSRRRQSLLLPSEMEASEQQTQFPAQESIPLIAPSAVEDNHFASLQVMIREYCSLPESLRTSSDQSKLIQHQTGYKLDAPVASSRKEVLHRIGPSIADMDKRKLQDTKQLEQVTGCKVQKSRNGKYRYISLPTNAKVAPEDYQARYMKYVKNEKTGKAKTYIEELQKLQVPLPDLGHQGSYPNTGNVPEPRQGEESTHGGALQHTEEQPENETTRPLPIERVSPTAISQDQEPSHCDAPEDAADIQRSSLVLQELQSNSPSSQQPEPLLPLPSRDEESNDPEIALAEQELWRSIDKALEEYSLKVIAIREARKNGIKYKP